MNANSTGGLAADSSSAKRVESHDRLVRALFQVARLLDEAETTPEVINSFSDGWLEAKEAFRKWERHAKDHAHEIGERQRGRETSDGAAAEDAQVDDPTARSHG